MKQQHFLRPAILLILCSFLLLWGCAERSLTFLIRFPEVSGLKQNDRVYFGRSEIGTVQAVTYTTEGDFLVSVSITPGFKAAATEESRFYIGHAPAGDSMAVVVEQERPGGVTLKNGATVQGSVRTGYLDSLFKELKNHAEQAERELNRALDNLQHSLDAASKELDSNLEAAVDDLSRRLDSFNSELGKLPDSQEMQQLEESLKNFADEFQQAGKDVQDHLRLEILPRLRMELERLGERLRKQGREGERKKIDDQVQKLEMV